MNQQIENLNNIVKDITRSQAEIVNMIEGKSLPGIPSIVPFMDYNDEVIFFATKFYMHILVTRHIKEMIDMGVDVEDYATSNYAGKIEEKMSELISLCTGRTFLELTQSQIGKSTTEN